MLTGFGASYPGYRKLPSPRTILIETRLTKNGKSTTAETDVDTGWHETIFGINVARKLGIDVRTLQRMTTGRAVGDAKVEQFLVLIDNFELFINKKKPICSIGPLFIRVTTNLHFADTVMLGLDVLELIEMKILYNSWKAFPKLECKTPEKPKEPFKPQRGAIGTQIRLKRGPYTIVKEAKFDTGANSTVVGFNVAKSLGFPKKEALLRSVDRGGAGAIVSAYRFPIDQLDILNQAGKTICSIQNILIITTAGFEPDTVLIGRDVLAALKVQMWIDRKGLLFKCGK